MDMEHRDVEVVGQIEGSRHRQEMNGHWSSVTVHGAKMGKPKSHPKA